MVVGGGGSTPATGTVAPPVVVVTPLPTISFKSVLPAGGATNVATTATFNFGFDYTNATVFAGNFIPVCNGITATNYTVGVAVVNSATTVTIPVTVTGMPNSATCTIASTNVTATGACGTVNIPVRMTFTTVAATPSAWPPATIYALGTKVSNPNQLPSTCLSAYVNGTVASGESQCWKDAKANGTVKFIETPALMTGYTGTSNGRADNATRPVLSAYFRSSSGYWNILLVYREDGKLVGSDITGGDSSEEDWVTGTTKGVIIHQKSTGLCYEMIWHPPGGVNANLWSTDSPVTCPTFVTP